MDRVVETFTSELHPHAPAGSSAGGQFTAGQSGSASKSAPAKKAAHTPAKKTTAGAAKPAAGALKGTLAYNPKTNTGPGYNMPHGDPHVKTLQQALNRLGATDANGRKLAIDGKLGPLTTQAVKDAQRRLGLAQTGRVNAALLKQLQGLKTLPGKPAGHAAARSGSAHQSGSAHHGSAKPAAKPAAKAAPPAARTPSAAAGHNYAEAEMVDGTSRDTESFIGGQRSFDETKDLVRDALTARAKQASGAYYTYVYIADITDGVVIYTMADGDDLMQCTYTIGNDESVTLGDPIEVVRTYAPAAMVRNPPPEDDEPDGGMGEDGPDDADEAVHDRVAGRVLEAKGTDEAGGRVYRVRIIKYGVSRNKRSYKEAVMREAVSLYEGAKAYDHHRTLEELQSSTIAGMVGYYRDVEAEADGLYGDLHLLPSATHAAESLDAAIEAQAAGLDPVVGISHDVQCHFQPVVEGGQRLQEAVQIVSVDSADIVAKPSAGGKAIRAVAGGDSEEESDVPPTKADVLAAFSEFTDADFAAVGLARASKTTESTAPAGRPQRATEGEPESGREAELPKDGFLAKLMVREKVEAAGLPTAVAESMLAELPERILESEVDARVASLKAALGMLEKHEMRPTVTTQVAKESQDKKADALDKFFSGDFTGYRSFKEAYVDMTGRSPRVGFDEDFNRVIMRESIGTQSYDSADRATESMTAASWNLVLGDSITRRLVAEYMQPDLQTWRQVTSSIVPINDFRTQRIDRIGGYGTLPAVAQGAAYAALTSPTNEEVTYAITKRGGTEDITLEMIANDDVRAISKIPVKLGLAAAQTLYRFVWDMIVTNAVIYDTTALFTGTAGHKNYVANAVGAPLSQTAASAARLLMRSQTAYGDTADFIAPTPRYLVAVNSIEEMAWQLITSAVALPTPANTPPDSTGAANTPNLHQGLGLIVLDYPAAVDAWWMVGDPNRTPTIEVGFYQGRDNPELFTQSDPTVGSMFNADKVTYKIRHIYSGAVLDFRGFVKGK